MATTTYTAIANVLETAINGITVGSVPDAVFDRGDRNVDLRKWAAEKESSAVSRKWQLERGGLTKPEFQHHAQVDRSEETTLVVAYYVPQFRGSQDRDDAEDKIRADVKLLHDALISPGILLSGWNAVFIEDIDGPDREGGDVWFQEITMTLRYNEAQSLT